MSQIKKFLAMFLCLAMCVSIFPTWAFAQEEELIEEDTAAEDTVALEESVSAEPAYEERITEEPVYEEPVNEGLIYEESIFEEPIYEEASVEEPAYENPIVKEPVYEDIILDGEPAPEEPLNEEPEHEVTIYEEPVYEEQVEEIQNPVRVVFEIEPADAVVSVYAKNEAGEIQTAPPEEDGSYLLMPGVWYYSISCDGYYAVDDVELVVLAQENGEPYTVKLDLTAIPMTNPPVDEENQDEYQLDYSERADAGTSNKTDLTAEEATAKKAGANGMMSSVEEQLRQAIVNGEEQFSINEDITFSEDLDIPSGFCLYISNCTVLFPATVTITMGGTVNVSNGTLNIEGTLHRMGDAELHIRDNSTLNVTGNYISEGDPYIAVSYDSSCSVNGITEDLSLEVLSHTEEDLRFWENKAIAGELNGHNMVAFTVTDDLVLSEPLILAEAIRVDFEGTLTIPTGMTLEVRSATADIRNALVIEQGGMMKISEGGSAFLIDAPVTLKGHLNNDGAIGIQGTSSITRSGEGEYSGNGWVSNYTDESDIESRLIGFDHSTLVKMGVIEDSQEHTHTAGQAKKENEKAATCTTDGEYDEVVYCTECNEEISRTHKTVQKLGHKYELKSWTWSKDYSTAKAEFVCKNDSNHTQSVSAKVTSKIITAATSSAEGKTAYTASVTFEGKTYTDTKETTIPKLGVKETTISSVSVVSSGLKVTWEEVEGATKYRVYRKGPNDSEWAKQKDVTALTYTDKTVTGGTKYSYAVKALVNSVWSDYSAAKSAKYIAPVTIASLTNVAAGVQVKWEKSSGAVNYRVFRKGPNDSKWTKLGDTTKLSFTDKEAKSNTKYSYAVRCITKDGEKYTSALSSSKAIKYYAAPDVSLKLDTEAVILKWPAVAGVSKYRVMRKAEGETKFKKLLDTSEKSYTDKSVEHNTTYTYAVYSLSKNGKEILSGYQKDIEVTFYKAPYFTLELSPTGVEVEYEVLKGTSKIRVERRAAGGDWAVIGKDITIPSNGQEFFEGKTFDVTPGAKKTTYEYRAACVAGSKVVSAYSAAHRITVYPTPKLKSVERTDEGVEIKWGKMSNASGYHIYRQLNSGGWYLITRKPTTKTSYLDEKAENGVHYHYIVVPVNGKNQLMSHGEMPGLAITPQKAPKINICTNMEDGVGLAWDTISGVKTYRVYYTTNDGWKHVDVKDGKNTYVVKGLEVNKKHVFKIRCMDGKYLSSDYGKEVTITYYPAPTGLEAKNVTDGVKISWDAVSGISKYRVYRKKGNGSWTKLKEVSKTSYTDETVTNGSTYRYAVQSLPKDKDIGTARHTDGVKIKHCAAPGWDSPTKRINVHNAPAKKIKLSWKPVSGITHYVIECYYSGKRVGSLKVEGTSYNWKPANGWKVGSYTFKVYCTDSKWTYTSGPSAIHTCTVVDINI